MKKGQRSSHTDPKKLLKYSRSNGLGKKTLLQTKDRKAKGLALAQEEKIRRVASFTLRSEILEPQTSGYLLAENSLEKTSKVPQAEILSHVSLATANTSFTLRFPTPESSYVLDYSKNGKYMLIGGKNSGHLASFDWRTGKLLSEVTLKGEKIYDIKWLHNETMYAVAQAKSSFIYDSSGVEIHALRKHADVRHLEFLPYHMLLASSGTTGMLRYQDISTGVILNEIKTRLGSALAMAQNPSNAILYLGHNNGTATLWSPNSGSPLVKILSHRGPVSGIAIHRSGNYMASMGADCQIKIWDLRTYKCLDTYYTKLSPSSISFSQTGLLAVTYGTNVAIWKDTFKEKQKSPYLTHCLPRSYVEDSQFCPFDDILGLGHLGGISSILVPGAGETNFDSLEANPFESKPQRREAEVRGLLNKIQPDTIALDTDFIGKVRDDHSTVVEWSRHLERTANSLDGSGGRKRGKSSTLRRYLKKQENTVDERKKTIVQRLERQQQEKELRKAGAAPKKWSALDRFSS